MSGPSGVGKGTLVGNVLKRVPDVFYSISVTTRRPRETERDGVDYYFRDREWFEEEIRKNGFLEWACVYDDFYGTPVKPIEEELAAGKTVILEIDVQGAMQVLESLGSQATYVFIAPPSVEELERRLGARDTEGDQERRTRMKTALSELGYAEKYDAVIVNDDIEQATQELCRLVTPAARR